MNCQTLQLRRNPYCYMLLIYASEANLESSQAYKMGIFGKNS